MNHLLSATSTAVLEVIPTSMDALLGHLLLWGHLVSCVSTTSAIHTLLIAARCLDSGCRKTQLLPPGDNKCPGGHLHCVKDS